MFLRESLRLLRKEVLYYSVGLQDEIYQTLMAELTLALPRREMHVPGQPVAAEAEPQDLVTLHFTSRRLLSEFKTKIHSRIVVIGASCTVSFARSTLPEHPVACVVQCRACVCPALHTRPAPPRVICGTALCVPPCESVREPLAPAAWTLVCALVAMFPSGHICVNVGLPPWLAEYEGVVPHCTHIRNDTSGNSP